jgi:hypothetical protein
VGVRCALTRVYLTVAGAIVWGVCAML